MSLAPRAPRHFPDSAPPEASPRARANAVALLARSAAGAVLCATASLCARAHAAPASRPADVVGLGLRSSDRHTRIVVALSRGAPFSRLDLPPRGRRPARVVVDLRGAVLSAASAPAVRDGRVSRLRLAQHDASTVRAVVDLGRSRAQDVVVRALKRPPRLVIDVAEPPPGRKRVPSRRTLVAGAPRPGPVRSVVVDAGHGGHDTGAIGPRGVLEKDVALAIARRLRRRLRARGMHVVLTRDDDRYLTLRRRVAIANGRGADLLVSVHANAHRRRDRSGVETFVLGVSPARHTRRARASHRIADLVQREVCAAIRGRAGAVEDRGVKSAALYVLAGVRMPAVLIEASFITSRREERRLASGRFQDAVADGVARAIAEFGQDVRHRAVVAHTDR